MVSEVTMTQKIHPDDIDGEVCDADHATALGWGVQHKINFQLLLKTAYGEW